MPRCGATFDENSVPPWTRGDFRGVLRPDDLVWVVDPEPHPGASRHPSEGGDFQRVGADLRTAILVAARVVVQRPTPTLIRLLRRSRDSRNQAGFQLALRLAGMTDWVTSYTVCL